MVPPSHAHIAQNAGHHSSCSSEKVLSTFCFAKRWSQKATTAKATARLAQGPQHGPPEPGVAALAVDTHRTLHLKPQR